MYIDKHKHKNRASIVYRSLYSVTVMTVYIDKHNIKIGTIANLANLSSVCVLE